MKHYFEEFETVLKSQESSKNGLDPSQAQKRLEKFGKNKLDEGKKKSVFVKFLEQLKDPMIIVLLVAAVISGLASELVDSIIIMVVVVLNSILGVVQEGKAEKAIEALQKMSSPYSKVRRNGQVMQIKSEEIVPGDIVLLEAGDSVPADMRIIEASSLKIEEASLTGESVPIEKTALAIPAKDKDIPLGDRVNMAYMGTNVVYGRGEGVVINTGMATEMGKIANIISNTDEEKTPLQKKLASLSKVLSVVVLGICIFIFAFGVLRNGGFHGGHVLETFLMAISLAVAAIPEGLVAVVTIVLSIGVTKMSKRNSIIRKLTAVETLGCTQVICSDKTGTLTQNKMTVVETYTLGDVEQLAISMALCNDASLSEDGKEVIGEPTESALVRFAYDSGKNKNELVKLLPRVAEAPFDSVRKMMSTVHKESSGKFIQYTKGAPDELLKACTHILTKDGAVPLTDAHRSAIMAENKKMANKALRVLASAFKQTDSLPENISPESLERNLTFIGLTGMIDPVRPEVKAAIEKCRNAGIRPIMITGDHKDTAVAIAKELGILSNENQAITGSELSNMSDQELEKKISNYSVYARVQPEHKVRIVSAWKKQGKIVAMTGDGVNDAPALKSADIGVGMGITGTDVTKNVSDMVLADDNFASIVHAVEEGRRIYDNIRKAIQFLLSSNLSEVVSLFVATIMNFQLFSPIHILWINLVTDAFPAIALGMEDAEEDIMTRPPRSPKEGIFAQGLGISIIYQGVAIAILTLIAYLIGSKYGHTVAMTMAFLTMSTCEVFQSLNMRSTTKSIFTLKTRNKSLLSAMVLSFILSLGVIYIPGVNTVFKLTPLSGTNLLISLLLAFLIIPIVEIVKLIVGAIKK
ncbi:calcium-translocating P-type ATPase, PMCA-type [Acetivibrio clariflavus]|uniref:P-type Ca(2+) transporter n=1 Tax=Acetivibrio clariflavus (strain DSM 19732 / NBRC 101661 / EBR45) TaxID=720554 RepID=G8M2N1_ACECE|nr:calcium-translocating P-type ATPase, PMCA-type [Acetivibrio clariflavus]AEV67105.1 plasma-membrane calcium-translocating P-type ATPase [Acetivibrio clariflavus DSM 19732]